MSNIQTEINQGVLTVKIHRPERKNSLTTQMYADLANALLGPWFESKWAHQI
jgi:enoyl-CoA hydratase/carnithine racemase